MVRSTAKFSSGTPKLGQIFGHRLQLRQALVKARVPAGKPRQGGEHLAVAAGDPGEVQHLVPLPAGEAAVLLQELAHLLPAGLVQLVHGVHNLPGLVRQTPAWRKTR